MKLVKYNPLDGNNQRSFGELIEDFFYTKPLNDSFYPSVDIIDYEDKLVLQLFAPGLTKSDYNISLEHDQLTIRGERKSKEDIKYFKKESQFGSFERTFSFGERIDIDKITAECKDGILSISLPLTKKAEKKLVKIN